MKKIIRKFFKFTYLNIPIELFILFKIMEGCLMFLGFNKMVIITMYIDVISVMVSFIFSVLVTFQNIIRIKNPKFEFINWIFGKNK